MTSSYSKTSSHLNAGEADVKGKNFHFGDRVLKTFVFFYSKTPFKRGQKAKMENTRISVFKNIFF